VRRQAIACARWRDTRREGGCTGGGGTRVARAGHEWLWRNTSGEGGCAGGDALCPREGRRSVQNCVRAVAEHEARGRVRRRRCARREACRGLGGLRQVDPSHDAGSEVVQRVVRRPRVLCVCVCVRACARVCVRACARVRVRTLVRACMPVHPRVRMCERGRERELKRGAEQREREKIRQKPVRCLIKYGL
jgi:hypothetical protein